MTAPNADTQVYNLALGLSPGDPTGYKQGWMSRVWARKVLGDNVNKQPFTREWTIGGVLTQVVATPMDQDKITGTADALAWRRVAISNTVIPSVVDVSDMIVIAWEYFLLAANQTLLAQAVKNAYMFPKWPAGYAGAASFDTGGT